MEGDKKIRVIKTKEMTQEIKPIWKDIKVLDVQIRTQEKQIYNNGDKDYYCVEVGFCESIGERGFNYTFDYDKEPTEEEILKDVREYIKETIKDYESSLLSAREEEHLMVLKKVMGK